MVSGKYRAGVVTVSMKWLGRSSTLYEVVVAILHSRSLPSSLHPSRISSTPVCMSLSLSLSLSVFLSVFLSHTHTHTDWFCETGRVTNSASQAGFGVKSQSDSLGSCEWHQLDSSQTVNTQEVQVLYHEHATLEYKQNGFSPLRVWIALVVKHKITFLSFHSLIPFIQPQKE